MTNDIRLRDTVYFTTVGSIISSPNNSSVSLFSYRAREGPVPELYAARASGLLWLRIHFANDAIASPGGPPPEFSANSRRFSPRARAPRGAHDAPQWSGRCRRASSARARGTFRECVRAAAQQSRRAPLELEPRCGLVRAYTRPNRGTLRDRASRQEPTHLRLGIQRILCSTINFLLELIHSCFVLNLRTSTFL